MRGCVAIKDRTVSSPAAAQRYLAHVRQSEDGSFVVHDLEEHLRAVGDLGVEGPR